MRVEFQRKKRHFENPRKTRLTIFKLLPQSFGSMNFNETLKPCSFFVLFNKFERIHLNMFAWRNCNPNFEKWKNTKKWLFPMSQQEKFADLFLIFSGRLKRRRKAFHSYSFFKLSRNEALGTF